MRIAFIVAALTASAAAAVPPELQEALRHFRTDPPSGWSYTMTTAGDGRSTVERCDAAKPEFDRWSLVQKDGRPPSSQEMREYADNRSRRSRGGNAPRVVEQLDLASLELTGDTGDRAVFACRLKPGDEGDNIAGFLLALIGFHKPTKTIESLQLKNTGDFSPTFAVRISGMNTRLSYSLPASDRPSLPQKVETRVRGRAFLFKSLDAEMTVTFSDYVWTGRK
jgi:hypothetical protein